MTTSTLFRAATTVAGLITISSAAQAQLTRTMTNVSTTQILSAATDATAGRILGLEAAGSGPMTTRRWDGATWTNLNVPGPTNRSFAAMAADPSGGVVVFGGFGNGGASLADTWQWNGASWSNITATAGTAPSARAGACIARAPGGNTFMFGGQTGGTGVFSGETWMFDGATWSLVSTSGPSARVGATLAADSSGDLILFGGQDTPQLLLADTWSFDPSTMSWTQLTPANSPPARIFAAMALDVQQDLGTGPRSETVLIGGLSPASSPLSDVWTFANGTWTQDTSVSLSAPAGSFLSGLVTSAYDPTAREIVVVDIISGSGTAHGLFGVTSYGTGCNCTGVVGGALDLFLTGTAQTPRIGQSVVLGGINATPNSLVILMFGDSTPAPGLPVPGLLPVGCVQLLGVISGSVGTFSGAGGGFLFPATAIPNTPAFIGSLLSYQALELAGQCSSNGLEMRVGR